MDLAVWAPVTRLAGVKQRDDDARLQAIVQPS
jgi:hypothetical protein